MKIIKTVLNVLPFIIIAVIVIRYLNISKSSISISKDSSLTSISSPLPTSTQLSIYSLSEIAKHNNQNSCWMAIRGSVYDVTSYIDQHPDGLSILQGCGIDATQIFDQVRKHDPRGAVLLPSYLIGSIE